MRYLYILKNEIRGKYYIGTTNNPIRRLYEHNKETKHYTGQVKGEWKIIYIKEYIINSEAQKEELRLKKAKNKKYINWYIDRGAASSTGRATPS